MTAAALPARGAYVWIARTWPWPVIFHAPRTHAAPDVEITRRLFVAGRWEEHTGVLPSWVFTRCGQLTSQPVWEPGWSDRQTPNRFAVGHRHGEDLPFRLLNPTEVRPCRRCYTGA